MGRVLQCSPLYGWIGPSFMYTPPTTICTWDGTLTRYQQQAADRALEAVTNGTNVLIYGVCGSGKTEILFPAIAQSIKQGKRVCLATPRSDVVRELTPRLQEVFPTISIQSLYAGSKHLHDVAQLTISTTHQLIHYYQSFDTMIIDEVDAFPYHGEPMLPYVTSRAVKPTGSTIYITATPRKEQLRAMKAKKLPYVFVSRRYHGHDLPVPTFRLAHTLQSSLQSRKLPPAFYRWMRTRKNPSRQLLIFVPTVSLAEELMSHTIEAFRSEKWITSKEKISFVHAADVDRKEKVEQFREKQLTVLITTSILERGVTFPSIDVAIIDAGHTVFDEAALIQIAGRAGRSAQDPTGEVVFFHDGKTRDMYRAIQSIRQMNRRE
ncbi:MAG TPA: DEAD/DEAH box helicase [Bacillota bacterium]|nr:DEAD/DEAH box helicase [Bacillota bacterium]